MQEAWKKCVYCGDIPADADNFQGFNKTEQRWFSVCRPCKEKRDARYGRDLAFVAIISVLTAMVTGAIMMYVYMA